MKFEKLTIVKHNIPYLTTPDFARIPELAAGFPTRAGGVSQGDHAAFNFGFSRGDRPERVTENYRILADLLGADPERIAATRQVHSARVLLAERDGVANPFVGHAFTQADGMITGEAGIFPVCYYADCIPLLLYAPDKGVCAAVHSGWRGTQKRILAVALQRMIEEFHIDPSQTLMAIGPSICPSCFEVGEEVAELFRETFPSHPELILQGFAKPHIDLWHAVELTGLEMGMREDHITCLNECCFEHPERYFSHRVHGERRGVLMALIGRRKETL
ncbi:MAG: laccase domain-containing protein [Clostridia bacterium]|nr:laccase domain-containing protein [Clostridia bacterium]